MTRYQDDVYAWSEETARALREHRFGDLDVENVAEEILDVGKTELRAVDSRLVQILVHLVKVRYQPEKQTEVGN